MQHKFKLPVLYKGQELELDGKWVPMTYGSRFHIFLQDNEVVFEKDDDGLYRALAQDLTQTIDKELMEAVVATLEHLAL